MKNSKQSIQLTTGNKAHWKCLGVVAAMGVGMLFLPMTASALQGHCANCHTMHNSQGGLPMATDLAGAADPTPNDVLLTGATCLACHSNPDDAVVIGATDHAPMVYNASGIAATGPTNSLAGGNFYWSVADASTGHNVLDVSAADLGSVPPGGVALTQQLRCAGTWGCHGDRAIDEQMASISGAHHGNNAPGTTSPGTTIGNSYRFLDGIEGFEDTDWEYSASNASTNHNQYKGVDRTTDAAASVVDTTISSLCAQCHPNFHNDAAVGSGTNDPGIVGSTGLWGSPWDRHPTDFDMGNKAAGTEYRNYGISNGTAGDYIVAAPVASLNVSAILSTVTFSADDAIVTCISCHRAHGTEYHDLLRWDYDTLSANGTGAGDGMCKECHTTK